jgi:diadenosine tetraphosphate (Ap4A) HIT family hydrolase
MATENFQMHERLQNDTIFVKDLKLCRLVLMNNAIYPWFILIPRQNNAVEIIDLSTKDQQILTQEVSQISYMLKDIFKADKLNVAALGNMVPQLHMHIIARFKNDLTFPAPIWIKNDAEQYAPDKAQEIIGKVLEYLD